MNKNLEDLDKLQSEVDKLLAEVERSLKVTHNDEILQKATQYLKEIWGFNNWKDFIVALSQGDVYGGKIPF